IAILNISGKTIRSALHVLENVTIDEISMVSTAYLYSHQKRLPVYKSSVWKRQNNDYFCQKVVWKFN
ncbi:7870_t:CDS:2, partial [Entrophospora sp. SA101]